MVKFFFSSITAFLTATVLVGAQDETFGWMRLEKDPVYSAMAGACVASSSNIVYSAFNNPATIPFASEKAGVGASFSMSGLANSIMAGAGVKIGKRVAIAFAGDYNIGSTYNIFDDLGNSCGIFKTSAMMFSAGVGVKVIDMLSLGANFKYVAEKLQPNDNPAAFASDIYAMFRWKGLGVSAGVADIGSKVKDLSGNSFSLPSSVKIAVNYAGNVASKHFFEAEVDADYFFSGRFSAAVGAQYGFDELLFIRAGYRYGGKSVVPSYASVGFGVSFFGVRIDASYLFASGFLKNAFSVGLAYCF